MSAEVRTELLIPLALVKQELTFQDAKWGVQHHTPEVWLAILVEEVGELAEAILNLQRSHTLTNQLRLLEELTQVGAVAVQAIGDLGKESVEVFRSDE